jgi:hypothetical protein
MELEEPPGSDRCGGCHCGAVRFRVAVDWDADRIIECSCSVCTQKGLLHLIVPADRFELVAGADKLTSYRFNTRVAEHLFCGVCGVQAFYRPRSHPDSWDVNPRCLDEDVLDRFDVEAFDGDRWEENVHSIR